MVNLKLKAKRSFDLDGLGRWHSRHWGLWY